MKYKIPLLLLILLVALTILLHYPNLVAVNKESFLEIGVEEAKGRRFGLILDVRTPEQRSRLGYYPNSIPISLDKLHSQVPLDISNKKTWILVYSNGDEKARIAAEKLFEQGYPNVRYIQESYLRLMPGSK